MVPDSVIFNDKLSESEVAKLPSCYKNLGEAFYKYVAFSIVVLKYSCSYIINVFKMLDFWKVDKHYQQVLI